MEFLDHHRSQIMIMLSIVDNLFHMSMPEFGLDVEIQHVYYKEYKNDDAPEALKEISGILMESDGFVVGIIFIKIIYP